MLSRDGSGGERRDILLFLGVSAVIGGGVAAALFAFTGGKGEGPTYEATPFAACLRTIPALNADPLTGATFNAADNDLSTVVELAEGGDVDGLRWRLST